MKKFFNSLVPILILSFITSIIAIVYALYLKNINKTYTFYGYSEYIAVNSGIVNFTEKENIFEGNNITYVNEKDINVVEYTLGYYIKNGSEYVSILETSKKYDKPTSLKSIINNINGFNFAEPNNQNGVRITKKAKENIKNLYFILKYKEKDKEEQKIAIKILLSEED